MKLSIGERLRSLATTYLHWQRGWKHTLTGSEVPELFSLLLQTLDSVRHANHNFGYGIGHRV